MITDELREWASYNRHYDFIESSGGGHCELLAIADRIDAAHEKAVTAAHSNGITKYGSMVSREYVKLPVDADGVPIRVGDVMEFTYDPPQDQPMFEVSGFGANGTLFYAARGEVVPRKTTNASVVRHHHEPTVEDVLREFADRVCNSGHQWGLDAADTIAEYAAKLRLAGDAE